MSNSLNYIALTQLDWIIYAKWAVLLLLGVILGVMLHLQNSRMQGLLDTEFNTGTQASERYLFTTAKARGHVALFLWLMLVGMIMYFDISEQKDAFFNDEPNEIATITPEPPVVMQELPAQSINDASLNDIKASYEDAFVSFMVLQRCQRANNADYHSLHNALTEHLSSQGQGPDAVNNIIIAASGTYQALYGETPCEADYIKPVEQNLQHFLQQISR